MAKMTKAQIVEALASKVGVAKKEVATLLEEMTNLAYQEFKRNGDFGVPGIGKLLKVNGKPVVGRNPATGAEIQIPAKTVVKFRVAKAAKEAVL